MCKAAAMLTAVFDIGNILFDSEQSNNCELIIIIIIIFIIYKAQYPKMLKPLYNKIKKTQNKTYFDISYRPSCFLSVLLTYIIFCLFSICFVVM